MWILLAFIAPLVSFISSLALFLCQLKLISMREKLSDTTVNNNVFKCAKCGYYVGMLGWLFIGTYILLLYFPRIALKNFEFLICLLSIFFFIACIITSSISIIYLYRLYLKSVKVLVVLVITTIGWFSYIVCIILILTQ